ncbi:DUF2797 domain-containing protein [Simiduia sp. 21SJ11W-1]|uniref:DUF2797 domain-containing protein n=1 Tax=Simiduia sp. 21SJ11W-1 TaxID=2909669 RepID=UPI0020A144F2|nr:DUF2797 domain-containing protein [Simiduia sp. 21SJ11W-1]UTA49349.1 DUF2797 domain-containing protein [Simiduia sp. 21SJ11W-1]
MPRFEGSLRKMGARLGAGSEAEVDYSMRVGDACVPLNPLLGKPVSLTFTGTIECIHCARVTKKSFSQGFCYPCFQKLAQCDRCIMSPELCHFDQGTCREPEWAETHCMTDHIVYLANSSGLKIGITRGTQVPTRWIDQGAVSAVPLVRVATRQQAGLLESAMKEHVADKTNWRTMLKNAQPEIDMHAEFERLAELAEPAICELQEQFGLQAIQLLDGSAVQHINYPVAQYPGKITSHNAEKTPEIAGVLQGIRGQYWLLDTGVINLRKYTGYQVSFSF